MRIRVSASIRVSGSMSVRIYIDILVMYSVCSCKLDVQYVYNASEKLNVRESLNGRAKDRVWWSGVSESKSSASIT